MKLKQCNIKGFFTYGFSSLLFLRAEEKVVWTVCTAEISSESFPKILHWRPNLKTQEPAGPKVFFLKSSPVKVLILVACTAKLETLKMYRIGLSLCCHHSTKLASTGNKAGNFLMTILLWVLAAFITLF